MFDDSDEEMDEEAKARHREFRGKMKQHYSNEAVVAMREARKLLDEDEDETDEVDEEGSPGDEDVGSPAGGKTKPNGDVKAH